MVVASHPRAWLQMPCCYRCCSAGLPQIQGLWTNLNIMASQQRRIHLSWTLFRGSLLPAWCDATWLSPLPASPRHSGTWPHTAFAIHKQQQGTSPTLQQQPQKTTPRRSVVSLSWWLHTHQQARRSSQSTRLPWRCGLGSALFTRAPLRLSAIKSLGAINFSGGLQQSVHYSPYAAVHIHRVILCMPSHPMLPAPHTLQGALRGV
jgi:hypothetical protein